MDQQAEAPSPVLSEEDRKRVEAAREDADVVHAAAVAEYEAATGEDNPSPDVREVDEEKDERHDAVEAVGRGSKQPQHLRDATSWFLSERDSNVRAFKRFEINVSADPDEDHFIEWEVQAITRQRIRQIRRQSRIKGNRISDEMDETKVNLLIAVEGTVVPDLGEIASKIGAPETTGVLERRFAHKPGLIDQIAGEVLAVSGYDDDDVRDVAAGKP